MLAIQAPWATAPVTILVGGMMFGDRPSAARILKTLGRSLPSMILYQGVVRGALLLTVFLSPILPSKLAFMDEVILLERGRWKSVLGRSSRLCGEAGTLLFAQWFFLVLVGFFFVTAFRFAVGVVTDLLLHDPSESASLWVGDFWSILVALWTWASDLKDWRAQVGIWIVVAFLGLLRYLTYIDRRIRLEGWEVELRLRMVGATMEDAERW